MADITEFTYDPDETELHGIKRKLIANMRFYNMQDWNNNMLVAIGKAIKDQWREELRRLEDAQERAHKTGKQDDMLAVMYLTGKVAILRDMHQVFTFKQTGQT